MLRLITKPIGCLFSLIWSLLVLAFIGVLLLWGGVAWIGPKWLAGHIEELTGFPTTVDAVRIGIWQAGVEVEDIRIMNPPDYPEGVFLHIREIHLSSPWSEFIKGEKAWERLTVTVDQIAYVTVPRKGGNLERFLDRWDEGEWPWWLPWRSGDRLASYRNLTVGLRDVTYEDHGREPPLMRKIRINYSGEREVGSEETAVWQTIWVEWKKAGLDFIAEPLLEMEPKNQGSRSALPLVPGFSLD